MVLYQHFVEMKTGAVEILCESWYQVDRFPFSLNPILFIQNDNGFTNVPQSSYGRLLQENSPFIALI